jgi:hypothetical protein
MNESIESDINYDIYEYQNHIYDSRHDACSSLIQLLFIFL